MKLKMKMTNRSHRYDINGTRPTHGCDYTKYKMHFIMVMVICQQTSQAEFMKKLSSTEDEF